MDTLIKIIYNPARAFQDLKNANKFPLMSLIVLLIVVAIYNILMIPVTASIIDSRSYL